MCRYVWITLCISLLAMSGWCSQQFAFPPGFKFGVATSAYQIEGAWNVSDKGESIWDRLTHTRPELITDRSNGDVASDSYHRWREDIELVDQMGAKYYRLSISWPRLLPNGFANRISDDGKRYYNDVINGLLDRGIEPVVTLYHFDLPQVLQDLGGWTNPLIVDWFADYAKVVYFLYADRVKTWITINEPFVICEGGYTSTAAPAISSPEMGVFLCNKNVLLAHAKAWRIYDEEYKPIYHGIMSISTLFFWFKPATIKERALTDLTMEYWEGRYAHPVFSKRGGWPPAIEKVLAENSIKKGYRKSRLPAFTKEEIDFIRGTYDFYGLNHYTTRQVRAAHPGEEAGAWFTDGVPELNVVFETPPGSEVAGSGNWFWVYPNGLREQLSWIKRNYGDGNIRIIITENGYGDMDDGLEDEGRTRYYRNYLKQLLLAITDDSVNVTGYMAWSLMDNFEWNSGYNVKFGLYKLDFDEQGLPRTPRRSAKYLTKIYKSGVWSE